MKAALSVVSLLLSAGGLTDAAFIRRAKLKKKTATQYEPVVVVGQDRLNDSDNVDTVEVAMFGEPGAPEPRPATVSLQLANSLANSDNKRYAGASFRFAEDPSAYRYTMVSVMRDKDNNRVGMSDTDAIFQDSEQPISVTSVTIEQSTDTLFTLTVTVDGATELVDEVALVDVQLIDLQENAPIPRQFPIARADRLSGLNALIDDSVTTSATFVYPSLTFEDTEVFERGAALSYGADIALFGAKGESLGSADYEIVVQGL